MNQTSDQIHVEQLEVFACVGVTERERAEPQRLVLSLTAFPLRSFDALGDDIGLALNYSALCATTRDFLQARSAALIETFVTDLATHLLDKFPIGKIDIELRKFVLPETAYISVAISRENLRASSSADTN